MYCDMSMSTIHGEFFLPLNGLMKIAEIWDELDHKPTSKFLKCGVFLAWISFTKLRFSFGILTRKKKLPHFLNVYTFGAPRTWGNSGYDLTSIYSIDFSLVVSTHWFFILFVHQIGSFRQVGGENIYCRWACDPITSVGNPNLTPQRSYCGVASDRKYRGRFTTKSFTACKLARNSKLNRRLGALNRIQTWRIPQGFWL